VQKCHALCRSKAPELKTTPTSPTHFRAKSMGNAHLSISKLPAQLGSLCRGHLPLCSTAQQVPSQPTDKCRSAQRLLTVLAVSRLGPTSGRKQFGQHHVEPARPQLKSGPHERWSKQGRTTQLAALSPTA
jgi:hypothetical protein